jgi:hypothetical protein
MNRHIVLGQGHRRSFSKCRGHTVHTLLSGFSLYFDSFEQVSTTYHMLVLCKWLLDKVHSRAFWKGQGHLEHTLYTNKRLYIRQFFGAGKKGYMPVTYVHVWK